MPLFINLGTSVFNLASIDYIGFENVETGSHAHPYVQLQNKYNSHIALSPDEAATLSFFLNEVAPTLAPNLIIDAKKFWDNKEQTLTQLSALRQQVQSTSAPSPQSPASKEKVTDITSKPKSPVR